MFPLACQRAQRHANFSTWRAKVPKGVPIFQAFLLQNVIGNFDTLLYKKFYIIPDIVVILTLCICIVHKYCITLHFYTSCHTKEEIVEFLLFKTFCSLQLEMKI